MGLASFAFGPTRSSLPLERRRHSTCKNLLDSYQNLATLLSPTSYAEIRTSFRSIHRSLRAGLGTSLARKETQLLRDPLAITARSVSTVSGKNYGDHLTGDMLDLYKVRYCLPVSRVQTVFHSTLGHQRECDVQGNRPSTG